MNIRILTFALLLALFGLAGCDSPGSVDSNGMPKKLEIAVVQSDNIEEIKDAREHIRQFLQKKLGIPVEMVSTNDYTGVIEALKAKKVHVADIPPFAYVIATRTIKLDPIVTFGVNNTPATYKSVIISNAHGNIKSMDDIKKNPKNFTFCFVDPASTSGHLVPASYLTSIGIDPNNGFKQTIFAGNHLASVLSVKSGKIDVGCTTDLIFGLMIKKGLINKDDIRVLWTSAPIVAQPIVVRDDINKDFRKKIQDAYLAFNTEEPGVLDKFMKVFFKDTVKRTFVIARDSDYNDLRKLAAGIKDLRAAQ
jgi:phosphonate transport system substrate-binding protein